MERQVDPNGEAGWVSMERQAESKGDSYQSIGDRYRSNGEAG